MGMGSWYGKWGYGKYGDGTVGTNMGHGMEMLEWGYKDYYWLNRGRGMEYGEWVCSVVLNMGMECEYMNGSMGNIRVG